MLELLLLIGIVYWIGSECGDSAGTIALAILIAGLLIGLCCAGRKVDRATNNFVDYWAEGGPDKKR